MLKHRKKQICLDLKRPYVSAPVAVHWLWSQVEVQLSTIYIDLYIVCCIPIMSSLIRNRSLFSSVARNVRFVSSYKGEIDVSTFSIRGNHRYHPTNHCICTILAQATGRHCHQQPQGICAQCIIQCLSFVAIIFFSKIPAHRRSSLWKNSNLVDLSLITCSKSIGMLLMAGTPLRFLLTTSFQFPLLLLRCTMALR